MGAWRGLVLSVAVAISGAGAAMATTLEDVRVRGHLLCGVSPDLAGFSIRDAEEHWTGFDVALCRAVAAAVLGDAEAVQFTALSGNERFDALTDGSVDLLSRKTTWTLERDAGLKFEFVGINYYDGQGFMVPDRLGVASATQLDGASVCYLTGTTSEINLAEFFRTHNLSYGQVPIETPDEARKQYLAGACDAYTADASSLAAVRATFDHPEDHVILPEIISKEPLGPLVRQGDHDWGDVVRWTLNAMIAAEEFGVTSENVEQQRETPPTPEVARMLGAEGDLGSLLGLGRDWAFQVIRQVGNYAEVFETTIGVDTAIGLKRGLNAQWTAGGLLYAPPFR